MEEVSLRIPYLEIIEPAEDKMDRTPRYWVHIPMGEACQKAATARPPEHIKTGSLLSNTSCPIVQYTNDYKTVSGKAQLLPYKGGTVFMLVFSIF